MAIYTVHSKGDPGRDAIFVRDGFSIPAFAFTAFWALWHRMWVTAGLLGLLLIGISALGTWSGLDEPSLGLINLAVSVLFGFEASDLRRKSLAQRGYRDAGLAAGETAEEAELRYFGSLRFKEIPPPVSPVPSPKPPAAIDREPLGLFQA